MVPSSFVDTFAIAASNLSPLLLLTDKPRSMKRYPKFESYWYMFPECQHIINSNWQNFISGSASYQLQCKLQATLSALLSWSKERIGNIPQKIKKLETSLKTASESITDLHVVDLQLQSKLSDLKFELKFLYECENSYWCQRSRIQWNLEGERNNKYFHSLVNKRRTRNSVSMLKTPSGQWTEDQGVITQMAIHHFSKIFQQLPMKSNSQIALEVDRISIPSFTDEESRLMLSPITLDEVKTAVFSLPKDSSALAPMATMLVSTKSNGT